MSQIRPPVPDRGEVQSRPSGPPTPVDLPSRSPSPIDALRADVTQAEEKLAALIAYSLLIQDAAARVVTHLVDPRGVALLERVRETGRLVSGQTLGLADSLPHAATVRDLGTEVHKELRRTMESFLPAGFTGGEGLDYIAMVHAETIGHWSLLPHLAGSTPSFDTVADEVISQLRPQLTELVDAATHLGVQLQ